MACAHCLAAKYRRWGEFTLGCQQCAARSLARMKLYRDAQAEGRPTRQYRAALEQFHVTHADVLAAAADDFESSSR